MTLLSVTLNAVTAMGDASRHVMQMDQVTPIHDAFETQLTEALQNSEEECEIEIDLSGKTWKVETLQALLPQELVERIKPNLVVLKINDTTATLSDNDGYAVLEWYNEHFQGCPKLRQVYLEYLALGTPGLNRLRDLIRTPSIRVLSLANDGLGAADADTLRAELIKDDGLCHLTKLMLGRNRFAVDGATGLEDLLAVCTHLESFEYIGCSAGTQGSRALARGFRRMVEQAGKTPLREIDLDITLGDGSQDEHGLEDFCMVLAKAHQLERLCLKDAELGAAGLQRVLEALRESGVQLQYLDILGSEVGLEGAESLAAYLQEEVRATELRMLGLELNDLEDAGVETLVPALQACPNLVELNLACNAITGAGARALLNNGEQFPALQTLDLKENDELPLGAARRFKAMYTKVECEDEDDLPVDDEDWGV